MPDVTPAATKWLRVAAVLLALLLGGAAAIAAQIGTAGGNPVALAASAITAVSAAFCVVISLAPANRHQSLWSSWSRVRRQLEHPPATIRLTASAGLVMLGLVGFGLIVTKLLLSSNDPSDDDQGAFLITAQEIASHGGIRWLWSALWSGEFSEANRHPLYLALLSFAPTLRAGQWLSAALGFAILVALTAVASRRSGRLAAGIFCILLATNGAFCLFSARVVCDVLLVGLCGLAWLIHIPGEDDREHRASSPLRCAAGGAFMGFAWLTKGTGLPLFAGYVFWLCLVSVWSSVHRHLHSKATRTRNASRLLIGPVLAIVTFLSISSPLIARNQLRFGNPFHNLNSLLLFADRYEELDGMIARQVTTGEAAKAYFATHSARDIVNREGTGLIWEAYILLRSLGPAPLDDARLLFGLPLALLAAARAITRRSAADGLLLVWTVLSWLLFAWYVPIAAGERFILPLLAPILILAAEALARIVTTPDRKIGRGSAAAVLIWTVLWVAAAWWSTGFAERNG